MIDFQNGGLEHQVYELISKMCNLCYSDDFPHFLTKQLENDKWECTLSIQGVKTVAFGKGRSEVEAINKCASCMIGILKSNHDKNQLDPEFDDSVFKNNIEQFFGDIDYDKEYIYRLCETDILLDLNTSVTKEILNKSAKNLLTRLKDEGEDVDQISEIVTMRFLVKKKK